MVSSYPCDSISTSPDSFDSENVSTQLLRMYEQVLDPRMLATLEYNWGVPRGTIDLDASHNHMQLRADLSSLLHFCQVGFVPTPETFQAMKEHASTGRKPRPYTDSFPLQSYEYMFLAGYIETPLYVKNPETGQVQRFEHPYHGLPTFTSSAHPFHVLHQATHCVHSCRKEMIVQYPSAASLSHALVEVCFSWLTEPAPELFCYESEAEEEDDDDEASSDESTSDLSPLTPPRSKTPSDSERQCCSYVDNKWIAKWIDQTQVAGYGKESVHNSPDPQLKGYRKEPSFLSEQKLASLVLAYSKEQSLLSGDEMSGLSIS
ncbi:hypothetical protein D9758_013568 [Tetrapyrgos nigripes]|uniref:Uncharacterized protein n=1 Tax=Tetrapyrgos nigripes TaxID=182062 RepID=A0A8H5CES9_9AGAR|nr:hypothetical protein D9758_013568 [Tetrapyrgos nigripes]